MDLIKLKLFSQNHKIIHAYSTRSFGSMRLKDSDGESNFKKFAKLLGIPYSSIVKMNQVHSNTVAWITEKDQDQILNNTDGLLTTQKQVFLSVISADCVPLLFFDRKKEYIGVAHAGWRGLYNEIPKKIISQMTQKGSNPADIIVGLGPCIYVCCYAVSEDLAKQFANKFGEEVLCYRKGKIFLDLLTTTKKQLLNAGVLEQNMESANLCTADNLDLFYSYRKEGKNFGNFAGVIGII